MRKLLFTLALAAATTSMYAQKHTEIGFNLGHSNYLGDLQTNDYSYKWPGVATGVFIKQNVNPYFSIKGFLNYGRISGNDARTNNQDQKERNLSFRSYLLEWGVTGEFNLLPYNNRYSARSSARRFNFVPYVFGGINIFHFNPKTFYNNQWIELQPLNTEGQNSYFNNQREYARTQIALPFGLGFKYQATKKLAFSIEFGTRKTFTDYLDDVSGNYADPVKLAATKGALATELAYRGDEVKGKELSTVFGGQQRGNSNNKDWYMMNTLSVSYKLNRRAKAQY